MLVCPLGALLGVVRFLSPHCAPDVACTGLLMRVPRWGTSLSFGRSSPFPVVRVEVMPAAGTASRGHCSPIDRISPFPVVRVDAKHAVGTAPRGHTSTKCAEALRSYATDFSTEPEILGKRFGCLLKTH